MADLKNLKGERIKFDLGGIRTGTMVSVPQYSNPEGRSLASAKLPKGSGSRIEAVRTRPPAPRERSAEMGARKDADVYVVEMLGETEDGRQLAGTYEVSFPKGTKVLGVQAFRHEDYDRK